VGVTRRLLGRERVHQSAEERVRVVSPAQGGTGGGQALLGRPRSRRYLESAAHLDAGTAGKVDVSELAATIAAEFGAGAAFPVGLLSRCYLGAPYEVHILDLAGEIVEHYTVGQPLPFPYAGARRLALHPSYVAIEVYPDRFVCLHEDGTATPIAT